MSFMMRVSWCQYWDYILVESYFGVSTCEWVWEVKAVLLNLYKVEVVRNLCCLYFHTPVCVQLFSVFICYFCLIFAWSQRTKNPKNWLRQLFFGEFRFWVSSTERTKKAPKTRILMFFEKKKKKKNPLDFGANGLKWKFVWYVLSSYSKS